VHLVAIHERLPDLKACHVWVPAEDLDDLNKNIVGKIEVVAEYR
jgi:hypothetical protein